MARVIALAQTIRQRHEHWPLETLRMVIVCSCALALIAAHPQPLFRL